MSRLPDRKHKTSVPTSKDKKDAFGLLLIAFALSVCAIFLRWRSIQSCFGISAVWMLALFMAKEYLVRAESFWERLVSNGRGFAMTLTAVTGFLYALSTFMSHFPPDDIVDWGDRLNRLKEALDRIALASSAVLVLLVGLYVLLIWKKRKTDSFSAIWKPFIGLQNSIKRVALVLTMIASFSFTAIHAHNDAGDGSPFQVLTEAQAKALNKYKDLAWRINLSLSAEIKIQALNKLLQDLPPADQEEVKKDLNTEFRGMEIPPDYDTPKYRGLSGEKILCWAAFRPNRDLQWLHIQQECIQKLYRPNPDKSGVYDLLNPSGQKKERSSSSGEPATGPPPGTTLKQLLAAETAAESGTSPVEPPAWTEGLGRDVLQNFLGLPISADHVPFLKTIAGKIPLAGKVLDIVLDTISETASVGIQSEAVQLTDELLKNPSVPLASRIRQIAAKYLKQIRQADIAQLRKAEGKAALEKPVILDRIDRFSADTAAAASEEAAKADALHDTMEKMHVPELESTIFGKYQSDSKHIQSLLYEEQRGVEALFDQNERQRNYDFAITAALAQHTISDEVAKQVLGEKYEDYKKKAIGYINGGEPGHTTGGAGDDGKVRKTSAE